MLNRKTKGVLRGVFFDLIATWSSTSFPTSSPQPPSTSNVDQSSTPATALACRVAMRRLWRNLFSGGTLGRHFQEARQARYGHRSVDCLPHTHTDTHEHTDGEARLSLHKVFCPRSFLQLGSCRPGIPQCQQV